MATPETTPKSTTPAADAPAPAAPVTPAPVAAPAQAPKPTAASEFRKRAEARDLGNVIELPSGLFVSIKRPSVTGMIKSGHIPADVASSLQNVAPGQPMQGNDMKQYLKLMDLIVVESVVSPKVVLENPGTDEVLVSDFDDLDKQFIMNYVQSGVADLTPFRTQS